jgi:hypothetical protein
MVLLEDCFGNRIKLTSERLLHILEHPEMLGMEAEIRKTLLDPSIVRKSSSAESVSLFYRFYAKKVLDGKWLCVVIKYRQAEAFVVTAYLTNEPKPGEEIWPKK